MPFQSFLSAFRSVMTMQAALSGDHAFTLEFLHGYRYV